MSKIIVTVIGGGGFLGSHVADQLSLAGYKVRIFDSSGSKWAQKEQELIVGNVLDREALMKTIEESTYVYNFAALADLNEALTKPYEAAEINILGNLNVLDACVKAKVKRFVYASTVYVQSREGGFYRCSKQSAEIFVAEYQKVYGLDYSILRYGSLYGPRSDASNGLYRIVKRALDEGVITYQGSAEALREYIHVEDAALASVVALSDDFKNQNVVLTGMEPMPVTRLLKMIAEILNISDQVKFSDQQSIGHYVTTPYSYQNNIGRKYIPPMHVDLGQGLLQLIDEIKVEMSQS
jgi:UDP-glucose 4-epimerase